MNLAFKHSLRYAVEHELVDGFVLAGLQLFEGRLPLDEVDVAVVFAARRQRRQERPVE